MKPKTIKSPPAGLACFLWAVLILSLSCQSTSPRYPERNIARVFRRDFSSTVLAAGVVTAQVGAEVRVGARVAGKVERLYTNIGDRVEKGDVIAQLEKDDIEATVNQRKAELELARSRLLSLERLFPKEIEKEEADIARWQATVTLARKELARKEDLLKDDLASEQDLDQAQEQLAVARAEHVSANKTLELTRTKYTEDIKLAGIEVQSTKATLANAEAQLSFTTITAPISGVIASVSTQEGETVTAGLNAPTFVTIIDLNRLQTDSYVDEVDIGKIEPGQRAVFTVDAFQQREFEGIVKAVHPKAVIQDNVVNYVVEIDIAQPYEGLLRPEMTASVTIFLQGRTDVLTIPVKAIHRESGRNVVYLLEDGNVRKNEIKVGWQDGRWAEVMDGLKEGQAVLLGAPQATDTPSP